MKFAFLLFSCKVMKAIQNIEGKRGILAIFLLFILNFASNQYSGSIYAAF